MRKCPHCGEDAPYAGHLLKCENCHSVYCTRCTNACGGGCPFCGCQNNKAF